jgi:hypothetical protein
MPKRALAHRSQRLSAGPAARASWTTHPRAPQQWGPPLATSLPCRAAPPTSVRWSVDESSARTTIPMLAQWATERAVALESLGRSSSICASQRRSSAQGPTVPSPPACRTGRFLSTHNTYRDGHLPLLVLLQCLDMRLGSGQSWVTCACPTLDDGFETSMHLPDVGADLVCACRDISRWSLALVLRTRSCTRRRAAAHPPHLQERLELVNLLGLWHGAI